MKLLVVGESDKQVLSRLATGLGELGHRIVRAGAAQDALRLADQELPDAILCGPLTPPLDGIELCWAIRKTSRVPLCPFVLVVPKADSALRTRAYRTGVDLVVDRGVTAQELEAYFQSQLGLRCATAIPDLVMAGNLLHLGPLALVNTLSNLGVSGRLEIQLVGGGRGRIHLRKGHIVHAELGDVRGKEALLPLFRDAESYALFRESTFRENTVQEPTQQLILDLARALDEQRAGSG